MAADRTRLRFTGHIAGAGTASGTRLVLGCWTRTPWGPFADVMAALPDGRRVLLAPAERVAEFVAATYAFDEVRIVPVTVHRTGTGAGSGWRVRAGGPEGGAPALAWDFEVGRRTALGALLRAVPPPLARTAAFCRAVDPLARRVVPGVRTYGTAGAGRTEWYAASDLHALAASRAAWEGADLGALRPVASDPAFGFGSTPPAPSLTALTSTVRLG